MKMKLANIICKCKSKSVLLALSSILFIMIALPILIFGYISKYYIIKNSNEIDHEYESKSLQYTMNSGCILM